MHIDYLRHLRYDIFESFGRHSPELKRMNAILDYWLHHEPRKRDHFHPKTKEDLRCQLVGLENEILREQGRSPGDWQKMQ